MNKTLFPNYLKFLAYIVFTSGMLMPVFIWMGLDGTITATHYAITARIPFSAKGIVVMLLVALQMTVAYGVIKDRPWAIILGLIDSLIGICCYLWFMFMPIVFHNTLENKNLSSGLIILAIYFLMMCNIYNKHQKTIRIS